MRALLISPFIPREKTGGSGIKTAHTLDTLLRISDECNFFCFYSTQEELDFLVDLQKRHNDLTVFPVFHDFSFYSSYPIDILKTGFYYRRFYSATLERILKIGGHYDIALLDSMFSYQYKDSIKADRTFIDFHNIHSELLNHYLHNNISWIRRAFIKREFKFLLNKEKEIFNDNDISKMITGRLPAYYSDFKGRFFNHIPFLKSYTLKPVREWNSRNILFTGNFIWKINRQAISIFTSLAHKFREINFTLAGRGLKVKDDIPKNLFLIKDPMETKSLFDENAIFLSPVDNPSGVNIKLIQAAYNGNMIIAKGQAAKKIPGLVRSSVTYNDSSDISDIIRNIRLPIETDHSRTIEQLQQMDQDFSILLKGV